MRRALTFALVLVPAIAGTAAAQPTSPLRFRVGLWPDAAVLGASVTADLVPVIWPSAFPYATCAPCVPSHLWSLDRSTVGAVRKLPDVLSSGTLGAEAVLGVLFLASSRRGQGTAAFAEDATVIAEALTLTSAATEWTKILFHRPRPFLYLPTSTGPSRPDDGRSLPSGHTSMAFAAAAAYASVLHRRHLAGHNRLQIGAMFAAATATGVLRVVAHRHFPTDVLAGAALGFAVGWTVPALHATLP